MSTTTKRTWTWTFPKSIDFAELGFTVAAIVTAITGNFTTAIICAVLANTLTLRITWR